MLNIVGKTFGKLTVTGPGERRGYVTCRCECGRIKEIRATSLTRKCCPTQSCGCIQRTIASETEKSTLAGNSRDLQESNSRWNTNFSSITRKNPPRNNSSGIKGVAWNREKHCWEAYLGVHGKRIRLGYFGDLKEAEKARKAAEEKYHDPLITQRKQYKEEQTHA